MEEDTFGELASIYYIREETGPCSGMKLVKEVGRNCSVSLIIGRISFVVFYLSLQNSNLQLALKIIGIIVMENEFFISFINSTSAFLSAIGILLTGVAALIKAIPRPVWDKLIFRRNVKKQKTNSEDGKMITYNKWLFVAGILLIICGVNLFWLRSVYAQEVPLNQELTSAAWKLLEEKKYDEAISKAEECIETFVGQAEIAQEELIEKKVPEPPTSPKSEKEIQEIHSRGVLNDVGACYFIVGQSYEKLGNNEKALEAYKEAKKLIHAMVWDPKGWFWNVSKAAAGRIRVLEKKK